MRSLILSAVALLACGASDAGVFGPAVPVERSGKQAMALAIEGSRLYAGCAGRIVVYDIAAPLSPRFLGEVDGLGGVRQIVAQNGFVYATARESGMWIVDCTQPDAPRIRSRFDSCELATGIDVAGSVAFVGQRQNGVEFVDVSDPDHPQHIAMRKTDESQSVIYRNGYAYSGEWGSGHVTVFDARDMRRIRECAKVPLWGYGDGVWMKDNFLYAAGGHHLRNRDPATLPFKPVVSQEMRAYGLTAVGAGCGHGLDIFRVEQATNLVRIGHADFPPFYARGLDMWTVRTSANSEMVFDVQTHNGLFAVDCSDKTKPRVVDRWTFPLKDHPEWPSCCLGSVAVGDGCVYVAGQGCGVMVIPAKGAAKETVNRGVPPLHPEFREPEPTDTRVFSVWKPVKMGQARSVAVRGDIVYAACGDAGLAILKASEAGLRQIGTLAGRETVFDVAVDGDRLYTAEGLNGWALYAIDGETGLRELARRPYFDARHDPALLVARPCAGYVGISTRRNGMCFFRDADFVTGKKPVLRVGNCPGWDKFLMDAAVDGGRWIAYNSAHHWIDWIDLKAKPVPTSTHSDPMHQISLSNGLARFSDDLALVTKGRSYFFLKGEDFGREQGEWPLKPFPGRAFSGIPRCSEGGLVALTCRTGRKVGLWDFKDPSAPKQIGCWSVPGSPDAAAFWHEHLIVPCGYQGVIFKK